MSGTKCFSVTRDKWIRLSGQYALGVNIKMRAGSIVDKAPKRKKTGPHGGHGVGLVVASKNVEVTSNEFQEKWKI